MKKVLLLLAVILPLCIFWPRDTPAPEPAVGPIKYALLVGAEEGAQKPNALKTTINDPKKMAEILERYGGFEGANIKILTAETKEQPTYDAILAGLNDLVNKTDADDEVTLFFEGHGTRYNQEDFFITTSTHVKEGSNQRFADLIPHSQITELARKMKARAVVTIYENCRYDVGNQQKRPRLPAKRPAYVVSPKAADSSRLRVTLFSCMPDQLSYRNSDGSAGQFSEALQRSMEGATLDDDKVTIDSALKFSRVAVFGGVRRDVGVSQIPFASIQEGTLKEAQEFVLTGPFQKREKEKNVDKRMQDWQITMENGYRHMLAGELDGSLKNFQKASRLYPDSLWPWYEQAFILEDMRQNQRAQKVMLEAVKHQSLDADNDFRLGTTLQQWGFLEAAEKVYRQSLKQKPDNPETLCWLGLLKLQQNNLVEAETLQKKALVFSPQWYSPYLYLGQIYTRRQDLVKAEAAYRKAYSLDSKNWTTVMEVAYFLQNSRHKHAEAEKIYRLCLQMQPERIEPRINLAQCLFEQGKLPQAKEQVVAAKKLGLQPHPAIKHLLALVEKPAS